MLGLILYLSILNLTYNTYYIATASINGDDPDHVSMPDVPLQQSESESPSDSGTPMLEAELVNSIVAAQVVEEKHTRLNFNHWVESVVGGRFRSRRMLLDFRSTRVSQVMIPRIFCDCTAKTLLA